jgi:hypothetical protein
VRNRFHYSGFGLRIESEIELPELRAVPPCDLAPDVVIRRGEVARAPLQITLREELAVNVVGAAFLIRDGREIIVDAMPDADPAALRVVLLGRVMAFLFRQRGWLPLHASAIVIRPSRNNRATGQQSREQDQEDRCVLFLGATGAGKSTMAAAFYRRGHLVISDDVGAVRVVGKEGCVVRSAWSYVRLLEDARLVLGDSDLPVGVLQADKHRYDLHSDAPRESYSVCCAYVLQYGDALHAETLTSLRATAALSTHSFVRHRRMERVALEQHLRDCASVASTIPVRRLVRPRSLEALLDVVRFVEEDLSVSVATAWLRTAGHA